MVGRSLVQITRGTVVFVGTGGKDSHYKERVASNEESATGLWLTDTEDAQQWLERIWIADEATYAAIGVEIEDG